MTAAITGRPLLALLVACYAAVALCVLALCAASKRPEASALIDPNWLDHLDDGFKRCDDTSCTWWPEPHAHARWNA